MYILFSLWLQYSLGDLSQQTERVTVMLQNSITHHVSFKVELCGGTVCVVWALPSSMCHQDSSPYLLGMALKTLMVQT